MVTILREPKPRSHDPLHVRRWRGWPCCLLAVPFLYLYASVLADLVAAWWDDPDYSHGFLVPLLTAYFVWERRHALIDMVPQTSRWGLGVLLTGLCMLFVGTIGAEFFIMRLSMIVVISGLVLYLLGWHYLWTLSFPIAFLLFMIPLPALILNVVTFPLQLLAAKLSTFALQLVEFPVFREGNIIFLPHITLEIVEACSGLRSLMSLMALSVVFGYLTQRAFWKRLVLGLSSVPIALVANAFRIWGTGILAYFWGSKAAEGFYHTFAGWSVFAVAFMLLLVEGFVLSRLGFSQTHSEVKTP